MPNPAGVSAPLTDKPSTGSLTATLERLNLLLQRPTWCQLHYQKDDKRASQKRRDRQQQASNKILDHHTKVIGGTCASEFKSKAPIAFGQLFPVADLLNTFRSAEVLVTLHRAT